MQTKAWRVFGETEHRVHFASARETTENHSVRHSPRSEPLVPGLQAGGVLGIGHRQRLEGCE